MTQERIYETINVDQLTRILQEVHEHHGYPLQGHGIKYVDINFDNRDSSVFTIRFRGVSTGNGKTFTAANRCNAETLAMEDVLLYKEVMDWLIAGRRYPSCWIG